MLSNAYFLAKFRFDTAENKPAKNLQNFRTMHFSKMHFTLAVQVPRGAPHPGLRPERAAGPGPRRDLPAGGAAAAGAPRRRVPRLQRADADPGAGLADRERGPRPRRDREDRVG